MTGPLILFAIAGVIFVATIVFIFAALLPAYREYDRELQLTLDLYRRINGGSDT